MFLLNKLLNTTVTYLTRLTQPLCWAILLFTGLVVPVSGADPLYKLLIMDSDTGEPYQTARISLLEQLTQLGYQEGQNLQITYHSIGNDLAKGQELLRQELSKHYDVLFVNGTVMTMAAKAVAFNKPEYRFVFTCVTDPVGMGIIEDFNQPPTANFTGVTFPVPVKSRFKFIQQLLPQAKTIGLIYADMPQSQSYRKWVTDLFATDNSFKGMTVLFRTVPLITGENGSAEMAKAAEPYIKELDPLVDVFVSPNDQLGAKQFFAQMVYKTATKPLVGLRLEDVMAGWGATLSIYPSQHSVGQQAARMIKALFEGKPLASLYPEWPKENGFAFDLKKTKQFGITVPIQMIKLAGENLVK